jgi:hypothetical protein
MHQKKIRWRNFARKQFVLAKGVHKNVTQLPGGKLSLQHFLLLYNPTAP